SDAIEVCSTAAPTSDAGACSFGTGLFEVGQTAPNGSGNAQLTATLGDDGAAPSQTLSAAISDPCGDAGASVTITVHALQPVIDSVQIQPDFVDSDGGIWLNAANLQAGGAAATITVTADGADSFGGDAGATVTFTNTAGGTTSF